MKNLLKISVGCLFIALLLNAAFTYAQESPWLQINCHNPSNNTNLLPKWTNIISSKKPFVRQIRENRWEISFYP